MTDEQKTNNEGTARWGESDSDPFEEFVKYLKAVIDGPGYISEAGKDLAQNGETVVRITNCRVSYLDLKEPVEPPAPIRISALDGMSYGLLEARVLGAIDPNRVTIDLDTPSGDIMGYKVYHGLEPEFIAKHPEKKQNGRSAAYLKHDRTKRHGKPR